MPKILTIPKKFKQFCFSFIQSHPLNSYSAVLKFVQFRLKRRTVCFFFFNSVPLDQGRDEPVEGFVKGQNSARSPGSRERGRTKELTDTRYLDDETKTIPAMWPVAYFWKTCGVLLVDMSYNRYESVFTALVFASSLLNVTITPWSVCMLDGWCDDALSTAFRRLYTRAMACISLMSRAAVVYKARKHLAGYKRNGDAYECRWPTPPVLSRQFRAYSGSVVVAYLALMLPMNLIRLYLLYRYEESGDVLLLLFFINLYLQSWSMCCLETHFALLCYALHLRFRAINDELSAIRARVMVSNRYPVALRPYDTPSPESPSSAPLETVVELLRVRHGLTRESVDSLKNMFGVQLILSVTALCVMMLFDIYNEAFHVRSTVSQSKFIYGWMLQYVFRFVVIIVTAHVTSQEVV